ncbi:MAG TPA: HD domain-containing phosphohydrolase [Dongiaceae bacterium]|nr:HD domain-containing phosphohydrolase [Dongiaceae bacterium]
MPTTNTSPRPQESASPGARPEPRRPEGAARSAQPPRPDAAARRPAWKIVYTILLVTLAVGLLPLAMVAQKLIGISRESLVTSQQEVQLQMASATARQVDVTVEAIRSGLARLAEGMAAMPRAGGEAPAAWRPLLQRSLGGGLILVRYIEPGGRTLEERQEGAEIPSEAESVLLRGLATTLQGDGAIGEPIVLGEPTSPRVLVPITVPVGRGQAAGALGGLVDFGAVWRPVAGTLRPGYTVYAVDGTGRLLAANDDSGLLARSDLRSFGVVQEFVRSGGRSALTTEFRLPSGGKPVDYLASVDTTATGWGIFVQLEKRKAYAAVDQMASAALLWAGLAVGLAILLAYFLASTVTRPIQALEAGTEAFARGQLDHRVAVRSRNELGALAATFNSMAHQMQDYVQRLKVAAQVNNELFMGTIRSLAEAIDEKDPYTRGHSERVNGYAVLLAKQLGLGPKEIREVHISSLFHDIGKIGIEDKILRKPAMLTDQEYTVMKQHPEKGAQMLSKIKAMRDIIPGIRFHHERWDGTGYPLGLKGEQIPIAARIVAVADAFDAMTTNRPYQKAMPFDVAIGRLLELTERVYDRRVVVAFADAYKAGQFRQPQAAEIEEP